jgi:N-acetylmuramoyl-L-alanine amidase
MSSEIEWLIHVPKCTISTAFDPKGEMLTFCKHEPNSNFSHSGEINPSKENGSFSQNVVILMILIIFFHCTLSINAYAKPALVESHKPVVVLDPGHGGNDNGAQSPDGTLEKTVTLKLALLIAKLLAKEYEVVLTRTDDYWLDITRRTAVANQVNADMFVSLHIGSSFIHSKTGSSIYFFQQVTEPALKVEPILPTPMPDDNLPPSWDQIQTKYRLSSEKLAKLIQTQLNMMTQPLNIKIQGAPILVLKGADMPATAIEIGNLTNPNEEKALRNPKFLTNLASAISKGIHSFFLGKTGSK